MIRATVRRNDTINLLSIQLLAFNHGLDSADASTREMAPKDLCLFCVQTLAPHWSNCPDFNKVMIVMGFLTTLPNGPVACGEEACSSVCCYCSCCCVESNHKSPPSEVTVSTGGLVRANGNCCCCCYCRHCASCYPAWTRGS